jgi:homoserine kinase
VRKAENPNPETPLRRVAIRAPATTANLGPGFDTLGLALKLYSTVALTETDGGLVIECAGECSESIPRDETNIVYRTAEMVFDRVGYSPKGLRIELHGDIPSARGLGSSAAAIVGGAVAANKLSGSRLGERELLQICAQVEGHPDNVVPALVGGFAITTITSAGHVEYIKTLPSPTIRAVAVVPDFELKTTDARRVLPESFEFRDVVYNVSHAAFFVGAFITGNFSSLRFAMEDKLHQPYRESLIPGMRAVFDAAMSRGAQSVSISGSGPTLIAFVNSRDEEIGEAMRQGWLAQGITSRALLLELDTAGAQLVEG